MKTFAWTFSIKREGIMTSFTDFNSIFQVVLNKQCTNKKRYIRANQNNFTDKELNQAIIVRSKILNKFRKITENIRLIAK